MFKAREKVLRESFDVAVTESGDQRAPSTPSHQRLDASHSPSVLVGVILNLLPARFFFFYYIY